MIKYAELARRTIKLEGAMDPGTDAEDKGTRVLRHGLRALRRLIRGAALRVADLLGGQGGRRATIARRLRALADELHPCVQVDGGGQGRARTFRWVWPTDQRVRLGHVRALTVARTVLESFRYSDVGTVIHDLLEDHLARLGSER